MPKESFKLLLSLENEPPELGDISIFGALHFFCNTSPAHQTNPSRSIIMSHHEKNEKLRARIPPISNGKIKLTAPENHEEFSASSIEACCRYRERIQIEQQIGNVGVYTLTLCPFYYLYIRVQLPHYTAYYNTFRQKSTANDTLWVPLSS